MTGTATKRAASQSHNQLKACIIAAIISFQLLQVEARGTYVASLQKRVPRSTHNPNRSPLMFGVSSSSTSSSPKSLLNQELHNPLSSNSLRVLARLRAGEQDSDDEDSDEEEDDQKDGEDDEEEEEDEDEEDEAASPAKEARLSAPVPVVIRAKFGRENTILDQSVELNLQRRRTIGTVKDNMRRMLPNKPPVSLMQVLHEGQVLQDDVLIDTILQEQEEDEDDEDDEMEDEEDDSKGTLHLTLDMIPPVDGKFMQTLEGQLSDLTTAELLRLYATNEAALHETTLSLLVDDETVATSPASDETSPASDEEDDEGDEDEDESVSQPPQQKPLVAPRIAERAEKIEQQLKDMMFSKQSSRKDEDKKVETILAETRPPSAIQAVTEIRGERVIDAVPSRGVKTSLRRKIQHTFNVQSWSDTIRYICLFIFFGMFGGRTPMSRLILLLGAPSVLVLQARPVKLLWKQLLYTLINDPPGIFLSLLPAPQQALFNLDTTEAMQNIYGSYATETKDLEEATEKKLKMRRLGGEEAAVSESEDDEDFFDADEEEFFDAKEEESDDEDEDDEDDDDSDDDDDEDSDDE